MLHEILLALSGHPSPLFPATGPPGRSGDAFVDKDFPLLSSSEAALLATVGKLASLHRQIRDHAGQIVSEHPSTVCRAVAASLLQIHLARFCDKILYVEKQILTQDAAIVGAYNIVPLSAVVGEFDEWSRRMEWYWNLVCFIQPLESHHAARSKRATGAGLIDYLRAEVQTGFSDLETAATELSCVADKAWLKQVSVWLLYGLLPSHGVEDFFVMVQEIPEGPSSYVLRRELLPKLVSRQTGDSLLFIGKSLHQVKQHTQSSSTSQITHGNEDAALMNTHLQSLSSLSFPLIPAAFSTTISSIRSSLSQKVLQRLLPPEEIKLVLSTFRQILLLDRGEFAVFLISEAQARLEARRVEHGKYLQEPPGRDLRGVMMKEGEINESLSRTWKALTSLQTEDLEDDVLDYARENMRLEIGNGRATARPSTSDETALDVASLPTSFNDLLFPIPTSLTMQIRSPLDLFVSRADMDRYSALNAYLLSLRRAHMRLSNLWRESGSRRANTQSAQLSAQAKQLAHARSTSQRKVWATCSAAVFLLSETTAHFEGELITSSWDTFYSWATAQHHDPETLGRAHRSFLAALSYAILLTDAAYTHSLRDLLSHIDALVALFGRLQRLQQTTSLGVGSGTDFIDDEEAEVARELDRSRKRVDAALKDVVARLRQLDHERLGAARYLAVDSRDSGFEVWRGGGVDRLLMKLDFGRMTGGEEYIV